MLLPTLKPVDSLLNELIKFSEDLSRQAQYLEQFSNSARPNVELSATPAQTVRELSHKLNMLLAPYVIQTPSYSDISPQLRHCIWREILKRRLAV